MREFEEIFVRIFKESVLGIYRGFISNILQGIIGGIFRYTFANTPRRICLRVSDEAPEEIHDETIKVPTGSYRESP